MERSRFSKVTNVPVRSGDELLADQSCGFVWSGLAVTFPLFRPLLATNISLRDPNPLNSSSSCDNIPRKNAKPQNLLKQLYCFLGNLCGLAALRGMLHTNILKLDLATAALELVQPRSTNTQQRQIKRGRNGRRRRVRRRYNRYRTTNSALNRRLPCRTAIRRRHQRQRRILNLVSECTDGHTRQSAERGGGIVRAE